MSQEQRLVRHASRMAVVTLFCRVSGYLRDKALFSVIGAGFFYDAYRTANRIPNAFRGLFAEGTLHAAFVPALSQLVGREGDRELRGGCNRRTHRSRSPRALRGRTLVRGSTLHASRQDPAGLHRTDIGGDCRMVVQPVRTGDTGLVTTRG